MPLFGGITLPKSPDLDNARRLDAAVISTIRRMHRLGMAIDRDYLQDLGAEFAVEMRELAKDLASYIPVERLDEFIAGEVEEEEEEREGREEGDREEGGLSCESGVITSDLLRESFNPSSARQIERLLFDILDLGADKRDKLSRTKSGDRFSTGKRQLETLRYDHPIVPKILRYREVSKLKTTYALKLPLLAKFHPRGDSCPICELRHSTGQWRVHGEIGTTRAATWRFNHKNPNLGNIPTRTDDGQRVQAGFIAPEGKVLVVRDLSQIELRGLAHLSQCRSMIETYNSGGDIHDKTCHDTGLTPAGEKPDKIRHRMAAKRVNFGIMNGTTEKGLFLQLVSDFGTNNMPVPDWLTEDWCKQFIGMWLDAFPEVREYFDRQHYRARRYGLVWNEFGFCRLVPEVHSTHSWIRDAGLRQAQNMPITSIAAGQMKLALVRSDYALGQLYREQSAWPLMTVHDAGMWEVDADREEEVSGLTEWAFDGCMDDESTGERMFRVPITSDGEAMTRWIK
jgi:DNA polymerase-1